MTLTAPGHFWRAMVGICSMLALGRLSTFAVVRDPSLDVV